MRQSGLCVLIVGLCCVGSRAFAEETTTVAASLPYVFTLPDGFEIEAVAAPPLVERPITADFDERGRLYVAESSGSNAPVEQQLQERTHSILRLEDTDQDGRFDRRTVFADRMMFPEGTMWLDGSLYVAAPPSIWKLTDTDDDGVADTREEWFKGKTLTGCANDLHGPYHGPDGWIYWCKGAFAEQTYPRAGRPNFVTRASHVFRCRPDGSGLEPVMTGGMDNPVDVAFTTTGERIFTTTFLQNPAGGRRDGLIHAIYGGVYGKENAVLSGHPQTGELMPVLSHLGAAAPCGLTSYLLQEFGRDYYGNLFAAQFNMHKVSRHVLSDDGAGYQSKDEDFVVADSLDFHPTDVLADADGSLIVVDTGGWYKLCCPTSQLSKPDVLGAIYRVKRTGAKPSSDARGAEIAWNNLDAGGLAELLGDDRPAVRERATAALAKIGEPVVAPIVDRLQREQITRTRQQAVWALTRIDVDSARAGVRSALLDPEPSVRQVALHSVSLWRDAAARGTIEAILLDDSDNKCRRLSAEVLGRLESRQSVGLLLQAAGVADSDRSLEHAVTYALIEINYPRCTVQGLHGNAHAQRAALIALNEMPAGNLKAEQVVPLLGSDEPILKEAANWIVGRHDDWGDSLAAYLRKHLQTEDLSDEELVDVQTQLTRYAHSPAVQALIAEVACDQELPTAQRLVALSAMARGGVEAVIEPWRAALIAALQDQDAEVRRGAIAAVRALPWGKESPADVVGTLLQIANDPTADGEQRVATAAAVPGGVQDVSPELLHLLLANLQDDVDVALRSAAVDALVSARLNETDLIALTAVFSKVGPLESNRLLASFERSTSEAVGLKLVAALQDYAISSGVRADVLKLALAGYPDNVRLAGEDVHAKLNVNLAQQRARLEELLAALLPGDVRRGQQVFHSKKAACFACHAMGYLGGSVGPDLTQVGRIRNPRDLLESIVFPSASLVRSFEPVVIATTTGLNHSGLVRLDLAREVVLATGPNLEVRIAKDEIDTIAPGQVSIMPEGLDKQLSLQELSDLVEFLKSAK